MTQREEQRGGNHGLSFSGNGRQISEGRKEEQAKPKRGSEEDQFVLNIREEREI